MTTTELHASTTILSTEKEQLIDRLTPLRAAKADEGIKPAMSKAEEEYLVKRENYWKTRCERRKKISEEMWKMLWDAVGDAEGMKKDELREKLGLDE